MRYGVPRATLRREVQIVAGISTAAGNSIQNEERINYALNYNEREMALTDEWPQLQKEVEMTVPANTQITLLPTGVAFTEILDVWVKFGSDWLPIKSGIGASERSIYGPSARVTPIARYEVQSPASSRQIEVWPISGQDETLRITFGAPVGAMVQDTDACALDGDVLVLMTAADLLSNTDKDKSAFIYKKAERLKNRILGRQIGRKIEPDNWARRPGRTLRPGIDFIPPS